MITMVVFLMILKQKRTYLTWTSRFDNDVGLENLKSQKGKENKRSKISELKFHEKYIQK